MTEFAWPTVTTAKAVASCGWTPDRHVDVTEWLGGLRAQGYSMSAEAVSILESFGGLTVWPPQVPEATWGSDPIYFDPLDAANGLYERHREQEVALGHRMSPLASWSQSAVLLLDDHRVVCDSALGIRLLGRDFPEALDLVLRRPRRPEFLIDYRRESPR